jgi:hypothetical protein
MEKDEDMEVIKNYVENRYNFNVNYTHVALNIFLGTSYR